MQTDKSPAIELKSDNYLNLDSLDSFALLMKKGDGQTLESLA
jgi:hypothetical protein